MNVQSFSPFFPGLDVSVTATNSTSTLPGGGASVRLANFGTKACRFRLGSAATAVAVANDPVLLAGSVEIFNVGGATSVGLKCDASDSTSVNISVGEGT